MCVVIVVLPSGCRWVAVARLASKVNRGSNFVYLSFGRRLRPGVTVSRTAPGAAGLPRYRRGRWNALSTDRLLRLGAPGWLAIIAHFPDARCRDHDRVRPRLYEPPWPRCPRRLAVARARRHRAEEPRPAGRGRCAGRRPRGVVPRQRAGPRRRPRQWPGASDAGPPGADPGAHRRHDRGPAPGRHAARPDRRDPRHALCALGYPDRQDARAAGRGRDHLRIAAERDHRRRQPVPEVRQRDHPARRLRGDPLQPGDRPLHPAGPGRGQPAGRRRAGGGNHRPRRGRCADQHARIRRRDRPRAAARA